MYVYLKRIKCPACQKEQVFNPSLKINYKPDVNYDLILSCSSECAQKFVRKNIVVEQEEVMLTNKGPIPYRKITRTLEN